MERKSKKKRIEPNYRPYPSGVYNAHDSKVLGSIFLLKPLLEKIGLRDLVDEICPLNSNRYEITVGEACALAVLNRLHSPRPLYKFEDWSESISTIDLYGIPPELLNASKISRTLEILAENMDAIDFALMSLLVTKFDIKPSLCLWDSTSYYFEGDYTASEMLKLGYNRDNHPECKQLNLGLCVDADSGVPLQYKIAPGNTSDVTMVVDHLEKLKSNLKKLNIDDFIAVSDRALTTVDNVFALDNENERMKFIAPCSSDTIYLDLIKTVEELEFKRFNYKDKIFKVAERGLCISRQNPKNTKNEEHKWFRAIIVYSPTKYDRDRKKRAKDIAAIDAWIEELITKKLNVRKYKKQQYVERMFDTRFKGFQSKYKKAYTLTITGGDGALTAIVDKDEQMIKDMETLDGKYVLLANVFDEEYDAISLFRHSRKRTDIEIKMRYLKHQVNTTT